jgi:glucan-binding YG repeat protein
MQTNRFITTNNKTYFVDNTGAMVTGWLEFNKDLKVSVNGANYDNVAAAFPVALGGDTLPLTDKTQYKTVWCYFNEDGSMVKNEWKAVDGIWYYFQDRFCLISEYHYNVPDSKGNACYYGFDASGAVLSGWVAIPKTTKTEATGSGPNATAATSSTSYTWTYYGSGCKQATAGWLKDADGNWFYMVADDVAGVVAVANTYFKDVDDNYYYFNDSCYMSTGETTIAGGSNKNGKDINVLTNTAAGVVTGAAMNVAKGKTMTLSFSATGALLKGIQGNEYYEDNLGKKYAVAVKVVDGAIVVEATAKDNKAALGTKYTESFILIDKDNKVRFFDNGVMVKLDTVVFGDKLLAFDKDGVLVGSTAVTINGVKYVADATELVAGVKFSKVTK